MDEQNQNSISQKDIENQKEEISDNFIDFSNTEPEELENDFGFLDFEDFEESSETEKQNMEFLNKTTTEKVSALSWIDEYKIEQEDMDNINDILNDFYNLQDARKELDDYYLEASLQVFDAFAKLFNQTIEFMDMSFVIIKLMESVSEIYKKINEEQKTTLKTFIDNVVDDLNKWTKEVLNEKTALNIHYLDASIYSSVAQLELVFNDLNKQDKTEDLELF